MKELSIEQKARRYDEAIKKAEVLYKTAEPMSGCNVLLETVFPELKESEDERIRKELISFFTERAKHTEDSTFNGLSSKEIIAWLEKQGKNNMGISEATKKELEDNLNNALEKETPESCNEFLDEQGEQKPAEEYNITGIGSKNAQGKLGEMIKNIKPVNEVLEQKPDDKVEPKFKVGDWVFIEEVKGHKDGPFQIKTVDSFGYSFDEYYTIPFMYEDLLSKWTLQDAKDGDVLYSLDSNLPFIYKERNGYEQATAYCGLNIYGKFFVWGTKDCVITLSNYVPATKEQCNTLMKAMADAGYTFDFDKKELKKIGQNNADEYIEVKRLSKIEAEAAELTNEMFDKNHNLTDFERTLADICIGWIGEELGWQQYIKDNADVLLKIAVKKFNSVQDTPFERNFTWSEEDEKILNYLLWFYDTRFRWNDTCGDDIKFGDIVNFLKSLKERYSWKPSDEQMKALDNARHSNPFNVHVLDTLFHDLKIKGGKL